MGLKSQKLTYTLKAFIIKYILKAEQNMAENIIFEKADKIKVFLMDVDGVLTDGRIFFVPRPDGKGMTETKGFCSLDGIGLRLLNQFGIMTGLITGRVSEASVTRAESLGMSCVYQGFVSKLAPLKAIIKEKGFSMENVAYMGDDWTDIPAMKAAGLAFAPSNARPEAKEAAHYTTGLAGGYGAVREACEIILRGRGVFEKCLKQAEEARWPKINRAGIKIITGAE